MARYDDKKQVKCSFCGKSQDQVRRIIAGPGVFICDECVELCSEIIDEGFEEARIDDKDYEHLPKPKEVKSFLDQYVIGQEKAKKYYLLLFITIIKEYIQI